MLVPEIAHAAAQARPEHKPVGVQIIEMRPNHGKQSAATPVGPCPIAMRLDLGRFGFHEGSLVKHLRGDSTSTA